MKKKTVSWNDVTLPLNQKNLDRVKEERKEDRIVSWMNQNDLTQTLNQKNLDRENVRNLLPKLLKYPCRLDKNPIFDGPMLVFENANTDDIVENVLALINVQNKLNIVINIKPGGPGAIGFYFPSTSNFKPHNVDSALTNLIGRMNELYDAQIVESEMKDVISKRYVK